MRRLLRNQDGSAIVTALMLTMLMLSVSFVTLSLVDNQQRESGRERKRESTFQLSEGVLNSQIFLLSRAWPGTAATAYPTTCSPGTGADARCPDTSALVNSFRGVDYDAGLDWSTSIRDNTTPSAENYYDEAFVAQQPTWDANRDSYMWVRARGTLPDGRSRTIVALVKAEELATNFPRHAVVAGSINLTQQGNQTYLNSRSDTGENGRIVVRCVPPSSGANPCHNDTRPNQIGPGDVEYVPAQPAAMNPETIDLMRDTARANGSYYAAGQCPPTLTGQLIFIEVATTCSAYNQSGSQVYNSAAAPGVVIVGSGYWEMTGNDIYHGLIYHVNGSDGVGTPRPANQPAVSLTGGFVVAGAVIIDGNGMLNVGNNNGGNANNGNIQFNGAARNALRAFGTAGIVQNSFREIRSTD